MTISQAAIIGAGSWGTALSTLLPTCDNVQLWSRDEQLANRVQTDRVNSRYLPNIQLLSNLHATGSLEEALAGAEAIIFSVPCSAMREVVRCARPFIRTNALLVTASKGLEEVTGARMSEIIEQELVSDWVSHRIVALSGPNLAVEVARHIPTASVAASINSDSAGECQKVFMGPSFRVYSSGDLLGVELAGAMKNVIAIGAGIGEGLGFGDNSRAAFLTRGLAEITRLGTAMGAKSETFLGLAGVGDLIATGGSRLSRNYRVGLGIGTGRPLNEVLAEIGQVAEGVPTTKAICAIAAKLGVEMPISEALYSVLFENASPRETLTLLMMRPPKGELAAS